MEPLKDQTQRNDMLRFGLKIKISSAALKEDKLVRNEGENKVYKNQLRGSWQW